MCEWQARPTIVDHAGRRFAVLEGAMVFELVKVYGAHRHRRWKVVDGDMPAVCAMAVMKEYFERGQL
jgi:hypothetical protein